MMDEKLYQSPKLSTSSLPPAALMSADHGDLDAIGHCGMIALTHTRAHTQSRRRLGCNQGIIKLKRKDNQWGANMLHEKFLRVMAVKRSGKGFGSEGGGRV